MNVIETPLCPIIGHNLIRVEKKAIKSEIVECKSCNSILGDSLNANLEILSEVQIEIKRTIRELFLLTHRHNRQRALNRTISA